MADKTTRELLEEYRFLTEQFGRYSFTVHNFLLDNEENERFVQIAKLHRTTMLSLFGVKDDVEDEALLAEDLSSVGDVKQLAWPIKVMQLCYSGLSGKTRPRELTDYLKETGRHGIYSERAREVFNRHSDVPYFQEWARAVRISSRCQTEIEGEQVTIDDKELYTRDTPLSQRIIAEIEKFRAK